MAQPLVTLPAATLLGDVGVMVRYNAVVTLSTTLPGQRIISLEEVAGHDSLSDCWMVIYDRVYDITAFLDKHPGGYEILLEYAGRDATSAFRGTGHSKSAVKTLHRFLVGELPMEERIFRKPGGFKLSDMPA